MEVGIINYYDIKVNGMDIVKQYFDAFKESFDNVYTALDEYLFQIIEIDSASKQQIIDNLLRIIQDDVDALISGDPAARRNKKSFTSNEKENLYEIEDVKYVLNSYKSLNAVIMYRVAHFIFKYCDSLATSDYSKTELEDINLFLRAQARKLSEVTKVATSVEIHPAAEIGKRFVVDHGYGTVIGETCEIGDDCYILQGVTLGSSNIKNNKTGRRHPKLGNKVQIAGCARVFGPISIGDETIINGYAVVNKSIPPRSTVSIVNQIQLISPRKYPVVIYGIRPKDNGLEIIGRNLNYCKDVELLDNEGHILNLVLLNLNKKDNSLFILFDNLEVIIDAPNINSYIISVNLEEGNILLENSVGWQDFIKIKKGEL